MSTSGERERRRYGLLLLILIATYLLSAFFSSEWITYAQIALFVAAGVLAVRTTPLARRAGRLIGWIALGGSVAVVVVDAAVRTDASRGAAALWIGTLLLVMVALLIHQILMMPEVTIQSIFGAISTYLIIGLMFSVFYSAMYYLGGGAFFVQGRAYHSASDFQYFSFTTLTTLGYGDFTAKFNAGRSVAMLEAMTGQIFLATLVAKLVSAFRPSATAARGAAGQEPEAGD